MKKAKPSATDELRPEYQSSDFKKLERGKYFERIKKGSNVVVLEPQVAKAFPSSESVNTASQNLLDLTKNQHCRPGVSATTSSGDFSALQPASRASHALQVTHGWKRLSMRLADDAAK